MNLVHTSRIVFAAVLLAGISHARGDTDKTVLLVSGTAAVHARELASSTIETIAHDTGILLAKPAFTAKETATIKGCVTAARAWSCIPPALRSKALQQVAVISLVNDTGPDSSPMVVITGQIIVARLDAAISGQRFCVRCTDDVLISVTLELMRSLFQEIEVRSGRTVVDIKSTPHGARIMFDGNPIGATDRSFNTFQGTHTVVLELNGYRRESRKIDAVLDRTSQLLVTMRPVGLSGMSLGERHDSERCEGYSPSSPPNASLAPKLAMGTGALAVVAGAIVLAFNEKSTTKPPGTEQPRVYYDTMAPGVGLVIGGVVLGVGGYLWWRYTRSTVAPTVTFLPGGAAAGVAKSF